MRVAKKTPIKKETNDSQTVIPKSFQKIGAARRDKKSGKTSHECGKYLDPAASDATSHNSNEIRSVATEYFVSALTFIWCNSAFSYLKSTGARLTLDLVNPKSFN
jgi:hypothetical protein